MVMGDVDCALTLPAAHSLKDFADNVSEIAKLKYNQLLSFLTDLPPVPPPISNYTAVDEDILLVSLGFKYNLNYFKFHSKYYLSFSLFNFELYLLCAV